MATTLRRNIGDQIFDNAGAPLSGGYVYYYIATTTTPQATYYHNDGAAGHANTNPVQLNTAGRFTTAVYLGGSNNYKEVVTDSNGVVLFTNDDIPIAAAAATTAAFALPYFPQVVLTSASSPATIATTAMGNMYLCNTASGSISVYLPDAAAVTSGSGLVFKKTSGANSLTLISSGAQTIDGSATLVVGPINVPIMLISDGANWRILISGLYQMLSIEAQAISTASATLAIDMNLGWVVNLTLNNTITTFTVTNWPSSGVEGRLVLHITNAGSNLISVWPTGTKWASGVAPTITASGKDAILLTSNDNLTTVYGFIAGQAMA
jgi:hypothetical protein